MFVGKARAYLRVEHLKISLTHKYYTRLKRLAWDKHSSLLRILKNYGHKTFYKIRIFKRAMGTYSNNGSQSTEIGKWVLDVLQLDLTSSEGTSTLLPAGVLAAKCLGEVLGIANFILAEKQNSWLQIIEDATFFIIALLI
jgi:hypothetical protein